MKLSEVVENWPPHTGAAMGTSPTPEGTDVVRGARVDKDHYLVLNLTRGAVRFTSAVRVKGPAEQVGKDVARVKGWTLREVGDLVLSSPS